MIKVIDVCKSYAGLEVLKGINLDFYSGKINVVIGKSGSGKTVLLKCLSGLYEIDKGQIFYGNQDIVSMKKKPFREIRKEMGVLFQGGALFDSMTVEENIAFPIRMHNKYSSKEIKERVDYCLEKVNLPGANKKFSNELSGGMVKRVAIARAIALTPKYLFCDEPTSGLDPQTAILIDQLIYQLTKEFNMTTVVNTHDMNSVREIGDYIAVMEDGKIRWQGKKENLLIDNKIDIDLVFNISRTDK